MNEEVAIIPVSQIIDPRVLLRFVNKKSVEYLEMLDSIDKTGLWNSIAVRPAGERAPGKYEVIDGFYRLSCCRDLGRETVPCIIRNEVSDTDVLAAQIRANAVRPETTTIEFAKQLRRIQDACPGITMPEIAALVNKRPTWVGQQLRLLNLPEDIQLMVDRGDMPLSSAYMLAKVPPRYMREMAPHARAMEPEVFKAYAAGVIKEFMEQVRTGKLIKQFDDYAFVPQPHLKPLKHVVKEIETCENAGTVVVAENAKTAIQGFIAGLKWVANIDREGLREQQKEFEARRRKPDLRKLYEEHQAEGDEDDDEPL